VAAASALGQGSPAQTQTTLTVPDPHLAAELRAAYADPTAINSVGDPAARQQLLAQLGSLDLFLSSHKVLASYRLKLWYVAHHAKPQIDPAHLAGLLYCSIYTQTACG